MFLYCSKGPWGEIYEPAKSASQPYLHCLSKMLAKERESSFRGWNRYWWIQLVVLYLLDTSLDKFEGKIKSPWWARGWGNFSSVIKPVWKTTFKYLSEVVCVSIDLSCDTVLFIVEMVISPCSCFSLCWSDKENINLPNRRKMLLSKCWISSLKRPFSNARHFLYVKD